MEGWREIEAACLKRVLEVTKSSGGREELEEKTSALGLGGRGGVGHDAEGLGVRQSHCDRDAFARVGKHSFRSRVSSSTQCFLLTMFLLLTSNWKHHLQLRIRQA